MIGLFSSSCFFFSSYGDHRDLHSFPTRRSSDLSFITWPTKKPSRPSLPLRYCSACPGFAAMIEQYRRDRKSTRLNSSHQIISYAVFCLKKKNKTDRITSATPATPTQQLPNRSTP